MTANAAMKVLAIDGYCEAVSNTLPDLKDLVKVSTNDNVRRVTRFVQLALIGAGRCCRDLEISPSTAVYFSSCRGDTEVTSTLLDELVKRKEMPGPVTFVNSVSNAACFHVARALGLQDRSNFVTNRFDPIAAALKTAYIDIVRGETRTALVGSVDVCSLPLADHKRRTQVDAATTVGEGSHWLLIAAESDPRPAIASIAAIQSFSSCEKLQTWLEEYPVDAHTLLAPGQHLSGRDADRISELTGIVRRFPYREALPHYDSQTGAAIHKFVKEREGPGSMLHVNSDPSGRYSVLFVVSHV